MSNQVWILSLGERHEGSCIKGVFSTPEKALGGAAALIETTYGEWVEHDEHTAEGCYRWVELDYGVDYITVVPVTLDEYPRRRA